MSLRDQLNKWLKLLNGTRTLADFDLSQLDLKGTLECLIIEPRQSLPELLKNLIYGSVGTTVSDEGTENNASDWADRGFGTYADEASIKQVGSKSLKVSYGPVEGGPGLFDILVGYRTLGASFIWKDLEEIRVYFYLAADWYAAVYIGFEDASGNYAEFQILWNEAQRGSWIEWVISPSDFVLMGIDNTSIITKQRIRGEGGGAYPGASSYFDGWDIVTTSTTAMNIDPDGNVAVRSKHQNHENHWQKYMTTDGVIKAEESGKVVVLTDIVAMNTAAVLSTLIYQKDAGGTAQMLLRHTQNVQLVISFREGLEGAAYDGSNAGDLYADGDFSHITFLGYMRDA